MFQSCHPAESKFTRSTFKLYPVVFYCDYAHCCLRHPFRSGNGAPQVFQFIKEFACLEKQFSRKLKLSRRVSGADSPEG